MKFSSEYIILDINTDKSDLASKLTEMKKRNASYEYLETFKTVSNDATRIKTISMIIRMIPALLLLLVSALELIVDIVPGSSILYTLSAIVYFSVIIVWYDKRKKNTQFRELCEENSLIEEINEFEKTRPAQLSEYLRARKKELEKMFDDNILSDMHIEEPYDKLLGINEKNEVTIADPVSFDTDTNILEYNLHNEVEEILIPGSSITVGNSPVINGYVYVDILNGKAIVYQ